MQDDVSVSPSAEVRRLRMADLGASLRLGWRDFLRAPLFGLFFAAVYVAGGWLILWSLGREGGIWAAVIAGTGFPLVGPFIACGLYEVSRRLEMEEPLDWPGVLGVILSQRHRQIPMMAAMIVVFFLFWNFVGHVIFALFLGLSTMTNISSSWEVFLTGDGLAMLAVGTSVGAIFAAVLFSLTVTSLPMLMHRDVDAITAMLASAAVVTANVRVMAIWGVIVAVLLFAAMVPWFLGLFLVLPLLGHATWHLYRRALD